jgi:aspartate/methionine/tyrosine aminotransferase
MNSREVSRKVLDVQPSAIHRMSSLAAKTPGAVALTWARPDADTPGHINEAAVRAIEGLFAAVLALLDPGDEVLMPSPNYMTHELMVRMASAVPAYFATVEADGWRLDRLAGVFSYHKPRGSYTMFPRIEAEGGGDSAEFCLRVLSDAKVAMTPGPPFGPQGEGHARLCFCSSAETINQAFDRLDAHFGG